MKGVVDTKTQRHEAEDAWEVRLKMNGSKQFFKHLNHDAMKNTSLTPLEESIGKAIVNAAFKVHKTLGPGLLEKVYEACVAYELGKAGFNVKRQIDVPIVYDGLVFDEGLRLDLLVNDVVIVELNAIETVNPVWEAQIISHLRLTELRLGYLINFNVPLIKQGIRRYKN